MNQRYRTPPGVEMLADEAGVWVRIDGPSAVAVKEPPITETEQRHIEAASRHLYKRCDEVRGKAEHRAIAAQHDAMMRLRRRLDAVEAALSTLAPSAAPSDLLSGNGWVFWNPDSGEEYSQNHPIESGECDDAEHIRKSTRQEEALWAGMQEQFKRANALASPSAEAAQPVAERDKLVERLYATERHASIIDKDEEQPLTVLLRDARRYLERPVADDKPRYWIHQRKHGLQFAVCQLHFQTSDAGIGWVKEHRPDEVQEALAGWSKDAPRFDHNIWGDLRDDGISQPQGELREALDRLKVIRGKLATVLVEDRSWHEKHNIVDEAVAAIDAALAGRTDK